MTTSATIDPTDTQVAAPSSTFQTAVLQIPMFIVPPASASSTIQITSTAGSLSTGQATSGLSWSTSGSTITLTIATSFIGTGWASFSFTPTGGSAQIIAFAVVESGTSTTSTATSATVSASGALQVSNPPTGVTFQNVEALIQSLPTSGGQILVTDPLFFVQPGASSSNPYQFSLTTGSGVSSFQAPTLSPGLSSPSNNQVNVASQFNSCTATINFTTTAGATGSASFTVLPSVNGAGGANGTTTNLTVNSDGSVIVTTLGTGMALLDSEPTYETTVAGTYTLNFTGAGLTFLNNLQFGGTTPPPSYITKVSQQSGTASFMDTNSDVNQQVVFTAGTSAGTLDPVIINDPTQG